MKIMQYLLYKTYNLVNGYEVSIFLIDEENDICIYLNFMCYKWQTNVIY